MTNKLNCFLKLPKIVVLYFLPLRGNCDGGLMNQTTDIEIEIIWTTEAEQDYSFNNKIYHGRL